MEKKIVECVPNFSEGRDEKKIKQITDAISAIEGVKLLNVDPGKATNRTVVTFVGHPDDVIEAAFHAIKRAAELIDMSKHTGEHPRMGATDVCPLIPVSGMDMEEVVKYAHKLGKRVGEELKIPVYFYENAASGAERKNLAACRAGEYEGLPKKLSDSKWKPDHGPAEFDDKVKTTGATAIGARDFLVAYNINLNTTSIRRANAIAFDIRERGRVKRIGHPLTGEIEKDEKGNPVYIPGTLKATKGLGWFIKEYDIAQISLNLTNINITPIHIAFDEACKKAGERGVRVTGSELVGLVPLKALLDAGAYFLRKQKLSAGVSEKDLVKIAIKSLGLDELKPFDPRERIIEYMLEEENSECLITMSLSDFADETSSESPAPGGGSISAYVGALGVSLGTMVANLSASKRGWDEHWEEFSGFAEKGQQLKDRLLRLVDEDTNAFNAIMQAFGLPKNTAQEEKTRKEAIQTATINAIEIPFSVMKVAYQSMAIIKAMAEKGNPNSVSDAGVGAACARTAILGAFLNAKINAAALENKEYANKVLSEASDLLEKAKNEENLILGIVMDKIEKS
jgi:glutamate formiminotransferase / formiminotetrahydrofolate cyclodeaminase